MSKASSAKESAGRERILSLQSKGSEPQEQQDTHHTIDSFSDNGINSCRAYQPKVRTISPAVMMIFMIATSPTYSIRRFSYEKT